MKKVSTEQLILDISVNLARVSDWILDQNEIKQKRVDQFLKQSKGYLSQIQKREISDRFKPTLEAFQKEFKTLLKNRKMDNRYDWAEKALTWGNILEHRARLA